MSQQHRRAGGGLIRGVDLEVVGSEAERRAWLPRHRLLEGGDEVERQRLAVAVRTRLLWSQQRGTALVGGVAAGPVPEQALVDVA